MTFLELFDETLDINSTENYELAVQASRGGITFCILDTLRNKLVLIRDHEPEDNKYLGPEEMLEIIGKDDFLTRKYRKTRILMPVPKFTLVPAPLYDQSRNPEYFTFNHSKDEGEIILSDKLTDPDAYLIFAVNESLYNTLRRSFPGVEPMIHLKPLLENIPCPGLNIHGSYIHVHMERDFFNLIIFRDNQLKLCTTYTYRSSQDILYYVLNSFRRLEIRQEETICFSGATDRSGDLKQSFAAYTGPMRLAEPKGNFTFSYVFNEIKLHRFFNLFSVFNCE